MYSIIFIAPIAKAEQKTYTDNEVNISKKRLDYITRKDFRQLGIRHSGHRKLRKRG